jgi:hypothetical protein
LEVVEAVLPVVILVVLCIIASGILSTPDQPIPTLTLTQILTLTLTLTLTPSCHGLIHTTDNLDLLAPQPMLVLTPTLTPTPIHIPTTLMRPMD